MKRLMNRMHRGEKGFTLIELLVVIAILGVIAAVVALNIAGFFGRGTLQAANTELHQAQTAIISAMADAETNSFNTTVTFPLYWAGEDGVVLIAGTDGEDRDASDYVYGPFRAVYEIDETGAVIDGWCYDFGTPPGNIPDNPWGPSIIWDDQFMNWKAATDTDYV